MTGNQRWAVKAVVLWIVLVTAGMLAAMPFHWDVPPAKPEPWSPLVGMIVIGAAGALVMTLLAERAILRGWRLGLVLGVVLYVIETGLSLIEAVAFNRDLQVPMPLIVSSALSSLLRDAIAGAAMPIASKLPAMSAPRVARKGVCRMFISSVGVHTSVCMDIRPRSRPGFNIHRII